MSSSDFISITSLLATVSLGVYGYFLNKKINSINMNTVFYNEIFNKILLKKLPIAVDNAIRDNFSNFDNLDNVLVELEKRILYLKFKNKKFYSEITKQIYVIDDFLSHLYKTQIKTEAIKKFEKEIENLYQIIYKNYNK